MATRVAVPNQRGVPVDSHARDPAAVAEAPHRATAAPIPGAVEAQLDAVVLARRLADLRAWRGRERNTVGIRENMAFGIDRLSVGVDRPSEVVDRNAVARA